MAKIAKIDSAKICSAKISALKVVFGQDCRTYNIIQTLLMENNQTLSNIKCLTPIILYHPEFACAMLLLSCFCLFVVVGFFNITVFLNLGHHFLIFDEFLIKTSIRQVPISKLSTFFSEEGLESITLSESRNTQFPNLNKKPWHHYDVIILIKAGFQPEKDE